MGTGGCATTTALASVEPGRSKEREALSAERYVNVALRNLEVVDPRITGGVLPAGLGGDRSAGLSGAGLAVSGVDV